MNEFLGVCKCFGACFMRGDLVQDPREFLLAFFQACDYFHVLLSAIAFMSRAASARAQGKLA